MANLVHFGKYYFPDLGGVESVTLSLAKGAVAVGHSVSIVCFKKTFAKSHEFIDSVQVFRSPIMKLVASQPLGFKYFFQCLKSAENADLVHLHVPNMLGVLCAFVMNKKVKLLVHWHSDVINKGVLGKILQPLEIALLRRSDCIVVTSKVYADASSILAPFKSKIKVIPIGVSDTMLRSNKVSLPRSIEEKVRGRRIVLSVGRLVPYKGFDVLIEAAKHMSTDLVTVIVGSGPLHDALKLAVDIAGVRDSVILTGRINDDVLQLLFSRAAIFCLPSTYRAEAFGVVLIEAMAYGLPIVTTDIPGSGVPWVNQHGISGLNVPVRNAKALALAFNQIHGSENLRSRLSQGARNRYLSEFTEELSIKRILALYSHLLAAP